MRSAKPVIDDATVRRLAVKADVCPATIRKALQGKPIRGMAGHRARATLRAVGLDALVDSLAAKDGQS